MEGPYFPPWQGVPCQNLLGETTQSIIAPLLSIMLF